MIDKNKWKYYIPCIWKFAEIVVTVLHRKINITYIIINDKREIISDNIKLIFDRIYRLDNGLYRVIFIFDYKNKECSLKLEFVDNNNQMITLPTETFTWIGDIDNKESNKLLSEKAFKVTSFIREQIKNIRRNENERGM